MEGRAILAAAAGLDPALGALATVVELQGSGYRRAGARMLVGPQSRLAGCVSGGCLEADVIAHGQAVARRGVPRLVTYDTQDPADVLLGVGLGCQGVLRVLIEPLAGCRPFLAAWQATLAGGPALTQALVVEVAGGLAARPGDRLLWAGNQEIHPGIADPALAAALRAVEDPTPGLARLAFPAGAATIYWERIAAPPALWICGAGLDAPAMARLAVEAGLRTTVLDHRPGYARAERFPGVENVLAVRPDELGPLPPPVAAIVMTHNYEVDRAWLATLLDLPLAYLGLLGPRRRTANLLEELGVTSWPGYLHAPLGLDIGAETPEEVALAAMAELKAVLTGRKGGFLRERAAPIHQAACPSA